MIFQESETVELKSIVIDDIKKEIIAFANCSGGKLYVGVQDDGTVVGVDDPDGVALQISNMVRDSIKPDLTMFLHYKTLNVEGKKLVSIEIQQGTERPYYLSKKGLRPEGVYVRQGFSSVPATNTVIRQLIKQTDGDHFEDMRSLEQKLTFDEAKIEFSKRNLPLGESQMKTLGMMSHDGVYTNLGLLLSDQCVHTIKIAAFEGTTQNQFKDRKECTGSLFKQMNDAYEYIDFRNRTHSSFQKLYRIDQRDYPEAAVREALLNLLVHREYSFSASSFISMYEDRLEFTSIGGLVHGVSMNDVLLGLSVCRNIKLANIFYRLELIEAYGTGLRKIKQSYSGTNKEPTFEVSDNAFKVIIPNLNYSASGEKINLNVPDPDDETGKIISFAQKTGHFKRKDIENILQISQSGSGRLIKKMLDQKIISQQGKGKNTFYKLSSLPT